MLVNAAKFPGPALWQGIMLIMLVPFFFGMHYKDGKYARLTMLLYVGFGIALFAAIIILTKL